ncbi:MAG TPA: HAD family phosphatase [Solirubrobacterales bacterium]|nr:HAD family phosphatase [Solirubrobacterales bacterium]
MSVSVSDLPVQALLCDADGCLFPSEEPAFDASAEVTNRFLAAVGATARFTAEELRLATTGQNFRTTARELARAEGKTVDSEQLQRWVEVERREVTAHLGEVLRPDRRVVEPLERLAASHTLAVVSSSATPRIEACLDATDLATLFSAAVRFSAENSLATPTSKPDPAIYVHALEALGVSPQRALAVEDSVPGATAAVDAGCRTIGNVMFVPYGERAERAAALECVGVSEVVSSWDELELLLESASSAPPRVAS